MIGALLLKMRWNTLQCDGRMAARGLGILNTGITCRGSLRDGMLRMLCKLMCFRYCFPTVAATGGGAETPEIITYIAVDPLAGSV